MSNKNSFANNFIVLFSSNVFQLLLGVVTNVIVARWLSPEGLGLKTVLANFPTLFVTFFEMGTRQSTIYFIGNKRYDDSHLFSNINALWLLSSTIGLLVYGVLSHFQFRNVSVTLIIVSALYIPIFIGRSFMNGILLGKQLIKKLAVFNTLNAFITPLLTLLFLVVFDWGVLGVLLASQLTAFYTLMVRVILLRKELSLKFSLGMDFKIVKDLFSHGFYYAVALFITSNFTLIPIFLMNNRVSSHEIGIYSVGSAFAILLKTVISSTFPILFAKGANAKDKLNFSQKCHSFLRLSLLFLPIVAVILYVMVGYLIPLMYGPNYAGSVTITRIMLLGVCVFVLQTVLIMDMAGKGRPQVTIKATLPAFLLCVLFNYYGIGKYGNMGAAASTSIAMLVCGVSYLVVYSKETGISVVEILKPRYSDFQGLKAQLKTIIKTKR